MRCSSMDSAMTHLRATSATTAYRIGGD